MTDITIYRTFPVINGYVQVPPNDEAERTTYEVQQYLVDNADAVLEQFSPVGPTNGQGIGSDQWVRVPF